MAAAQAFKVLTTFKFEVGSAIASSSALGSSLDNVSNQAKNLQFQLARVGIGFASELGLAGGGLLGIIGQSLKQFNEMEKQTIKLGGIFFANRGFISGIETANDALAVSESFLKKVSIQANKFGLNEKALAQFASIGVGITAKEGISPAKNIEFGRNILKAGPQLGIDPAQAQGQITRALLGGASLGDPAFRAVAVETTAFKEFAKRVGGINKVTKEFNKLQLDQRFNLLNQAFGEFTQNTELLAAQADTIPALLLRVRQSLFGFTGAFKPIGELFSGPVKEALRGFLKLIKGDLAVSLQNVAITIGQLVPNLETAIIRLQELSDVAGNFQKAGVGALIFGILGLAFKFLFLGKILKFLVPLLFFLVKPFLLLGGILPAIGVALGFLASAFLTFAGPLLVIFGIFQLISRAIAIARVADAKALPGIIATFSESLKILTSVFLFVTAPVRFLFNALAELISPLFRVTLLLKAVVFIFKFFTDVIFRIFAAISGVINAILVPALNILQGNFSEGLKALKPSEIEKNFKEGAETFFKEIARGVAALPDDGRAISQPKIDIAKIEIKNNFKEQMEPDRIAFTLKSQLIKAAQNPTQASGKNFSFSKQGR